MFKISYVLTVRSC